MNITLLIHFLSSFDSISLKGKITLMSCFKVLIFMNLTNSIPMYFNANKYGMRSLLAKCLSLENINTRECCLILGRQLKVSVFSFGFNFKGLIVSFLFFPSFPFLDKCIQNSQTHQMKQKEKRKRKGKKEEEKHRALDHGPHSG